MLADSGRTITADMKFVSDVSNYSYSNILFHRLIARKRRFTNVDFKYTIFDSCYLRDCHFDSCDFTGCRFISSNFHGSVFSGCRFDYTYFEKTNIDSAILDSECPVHENIKLKFARTLRTNYQHIGDAKSINKAISIELNSTGEHLYKSWTSKGSYYRKKYPGLSARTIQFLRWLEFKTLDFVWGNGESVFKLFRFSAMIVFIISGVDLYSFGDLKNLECYWRSIEAAPSIFLGVTSPDHYNDLYLSAITLVRLVVIGFFLSIIIKRFNRR